MKAFWIKLIDFIETIHPVRLVAFGYLSYIVAGWILLFFPFIHAGTAVSGLDALFTATSAVSTTGLVTVSTGNDFSRPGMIWRSDPPGNRLDPFAARYQDTAQCIYSGDS